MKSPLRLLTVFGTRPEAIKLAPLVRAIAQDESLTTEVASVGQHRRELMRIPPELRMPVDMRFDIAAPGQSLATTFTRALEATSEAVRQSSPDVVLVQGDTSTALAGALTALYQRLPLVHLEAGLRTYDLAGPFPEEGHRRLISEICHLHLAPTESARRNLLGEGIAPDDVLVTGNTSIDAARIALRSWDISRSALPAALRSDDAVIITFTMHRRENWARIDDFAELLARLATIYPAASFAVPYHPNQLIVDALTARVAGLPNVFLLGPLPYDDMIGLLSRTLVLLTDSGGLQEEAAYLGVPILVMRDSTERVEGITAGVAILAGTDPGRIEALAHRIIQSPSMHRRMARPSRCYGDGRAAAKALRAIKARFGSGGVPAAADRSQWTTSA